MDDVSVVVLIVVVGALLGLGAVVVAAQLLLQVLNDLRRRIHDLQSEVQRSEERHASELAECRRRLEIFELAERKKMKPEVLEQLEDVIGAVGGFDKPIIAFYEIAELVRAHADELVRRQERALQVSRAARGCNDKRGNDGQRCS